MKKSRASTLLMTSSSSLTRNTMENHTQMQTKSKIVIHLPSEKDRRLLTTQRNNENLTM